MTAGGHTGAGGGAGTDRGAPGSGGGATRGRGAPGIQGLVLLLYGGSVINLTLPRKVRFCKDCAGHDFECLSKNPWKDSTELGNIIKTKGYTYKKGLLFECNVCICTSYE